MEKMFEAHQEAEGISEVIVKKVLERVQEEQEKNATYLNVSDFLNANEEAKNIYQEYSTKKFPDESSQKEALQKLVTDLATTYENMEGKMMN